MAQATVEAASTLQAVPRLANCTACLTRDCPMVGAVDYPVQVCNSYREANCYLCSQVGCALIGSLDSPVLACDKFVPLRG